MGRGVVVACASVILGSQWGVAQARPAIDLLSHSRVVIDRPAARVWPLILDPSGWKRGLTLLHHAGTPGGRGEVFAAKDPAAPATIVFFAENVELEPNRRRSIKLFAPNGILIGFASWTLEERGGRTEVSYDVYSESLLTPEQAAALGAEGIHREARRNAAANQQRFDAELLGLKRLVERR